MQRARLFRQRKTKPSVKGQRYQFIETPPAKQPEGEPIAHIDAIDPLTAKQKWRAPIADHPHWSAMLATGGGLLFTGKMTGEFIAVDADSGKTLWQFQTGSGVNAQPVTFTLNGRQYVTILSGIGGVYRNQAGNELQKVSPGGSGWALPLIPDRKSVV